MKKKLYTFKPSDEPISIETQRTARKIRIEPCDALSIERGVRQLLADKVSGNMVGIWLLIPEYLRMGIWDFLCKWSGKGGEMVEPRLALQTVNESALCVNGLRGKYSLSQRGFELANGLPFVATDWAIHNLFESKTVEESCALQVALGQIRKASGHFGGKTIAIDPHHIRSYSKRQMRLQKHEKKEPARKVLQTFFSLDTQSMQPICFIISSSSMTASQTAPLLLDMTQAILNTKPGQILVIADKEYFCKEIFDYVINKTSLDLLTPIPQKKSLKNKNQKTTPDSFKRIWAGLTTAVLPYSFKGREDMQLYQIIQRCGEKPDNYIFKNFISTTNKDELNQICYEFPKRWGVEIFFNNKQAYGWNRSGTPNLNVRYAGMTMALIAQSTTHQLLKKIGEPYTRWEAKNLAKSLFLGLDGDIRVKDNTIIVTYYNAPNNQIMRDNFENLPEKLEKENLDPRVPWLYNFKLDFRFK